MKANDEVTFPSALLRKLEDDQLTAKAKLALLIRYSQGEAEIDRGGSSLALEQLAWRGVEDLCIDVLRHLEQVERAAGLQDDNFALLPNEKDAEQG